MLNILQDKYISLKRGLWFWFYVNKDRHNSTEDEFFKKETQNFFRLQLGWMILLQDISQKTGNDNVSRKNTLKLKEERKHQLTVWRLSLFPLALTMRKYCGNSGLHVPELSAVTEASYQATCMLWLEGKQHFWLEN